MKDTFYYEVLKKRIEGKVLPLSTENYKGETVILKSGHIEDCQYIEMKTMQNNGWIAVTTYYEDGTIEETYEK